MAAETLAESICRCGIDSVLPSLSAEERRTIPYLWELWALPHQVMPSWAWFIWLLLMGRGSGKTRAAAEIVHEWAKTDPYVTICGPTAANVRDIMVEGESGIMATAKPWNRPKYEPSKRRITYSNGCKVLCLSADEPERIRGTQHRKLWGDEIASWRYPESLDQLLLGLRLGDNPQGILSTTPRPTKLIKALIARDGDDVHVTRASTYANRHLTKVFLNQVVSRYEGTRMGRQEIYAEILEDIQGAVVTLAMIEKARVDKAPDLQRIVVAIDPAVTSGDTSDDTGIVVAGKGVDGHGYILADMTCHLSPDGWAKRAVEAFDYHEADKIIGEVNNGGDLVEFTIKTVRRNIAYKSVRASRGKHVRFEPIGALYEQGKIHHVGSFPELEDQVRGFTPNGYEGGSSPDRADAAVWALTELMVTNTAEAKVWTL